MGKSRLEKRIESDLIESVKDVSEAAPPWAHEVFMEIVRFTDIISKMALRAEGAQGKKISKRADRLLDSVRDISAAHDPAQYVAAQISSATEEIREMAEVLHDTDKTEAKNIMQVCDKLDHLGSKLRKMKQMGGPSAGGGVREEADEGSDEGSDAEEEEEEETDEGEEAYGEGLDAFDEMCKAMEEMQEAADRVQDAISRMPRGMRTGKAKHENKGAARMMAACAEGVMEASKAAKAVMAVNTAPLKRKGKDLRGFMKKKPAEKKG